MNIYFTTFPNIQQPNFSANNRQTKITKETLELLLFKENKSIKEIATIYNTSTQWIYEMLKRFNLQAPQTVVNNNMGQYLPALLKEGKKSSQLSETINVSKHSIRQWSKNNFGKTPREIRNIKITELMQTDLTDKEIAQQLDLCEKYVQRMRHTLSPTKKNPNKQARMKLVFEELSKGKSVEEISVQYGISKSTINRYQLQQQKLDKTV